MTLTARFPKALKWANKALDLFSPTVCVACGRLGPMICASCVSQFAWVGEPICNRCGHTLIHSANACGKCIAPEFNLTQVRASLLYRDPILTIIHEMKYKGLFALCKPLAQFMASSWPVWHNAPDLMMPVPLHPRRKKQRGFNQSALLAAHLGQQVGIEVNHKGLERIRNTSPQVGLTPHERQENVRDAFYADPALVTDKEVLLIDDVFTTGATMLSATKALINAGATGVSAYCLARTS